MEGGLGEHESLTAAGSDWLYRKKSWGVACFAILPDRNIKEMAMIGCGPVTVSGSLKVVANVTERGLVRTRRC